MKCKWVSSENSDIRCNREADKSGYCLFHKKNKSKRENILFNGYIKKGKISDFRGFYFENKFEIKKNINYQYKKLNFNEAVFKEDADFSNFEFEEDIDFTNTEFKSDVNFRGSTFLDNCIFKKTIFNEKYINQHKFNKTNFKGQKLIVEECVNFPRLDGVNFSSYTKFILKDTNYSIKNSICGRNNYRIARIQAKNIEDNENIGDYYYNERNYGSNFLKLNKYKAYKDYLAKDFVDVLAKTFTGYGEKPIRLLITSFTVISIFAFIYLIIGITTLDYGLIKFSLFNNKYSISQLVTFYIESWYFSMITFSTVGYGDITIYGVIGKVVVCMEVFLGITINAIWTSMLFSRMIR